MQENTETVENDEGLRGSQENVASYLKSIFKWGAVEGQEVRADLIAVGSEVKNHAVLTLRIFQWTMIFNVLATIIYLVGSNLASAYWPSLLPVIFYFKVAIAAFCTMQYFLVTGRIGLPLGALVFLESISLSVAKVFVAVLPDWFVNLFDKDRELRKIIVLADENGKVSEMSDRLIRSVMGMFAWVLLIDLLILTIPWLHQNLLGVVISLLGIAFLVLAIYGWDKEPFWMEKIQTASIYYVAALVIFYLFISPASKYFGLVPEWGEEGNVRIVFWFVFALVIAGWILFSVKKSEKRLHVKWFHLGTALTVLLIGLMIGGKIVNAINPYVRSEKSISGVNFSVPQITFGSSSDTSSTSGPSLAPLLAKSNGNTFFVDARQSQGIDSQIEVKSGTVIEVKASGKAVWKNIPVGNPTKYEETGPSGTMPNQSPLMTESEYWSNIDQYLCPSAKKGALIAKVGNGPWFYVGDNYKGEIKSNGRLVFAINDLDPQKQSVSNWNDNGKGFQVAVKVG